MILNIWWQNLKFLPHPKWKESFHRPSSSGKGSLQVGFFLDYIWVCLKMGYTTNYSHLVGIMIINHWVQWGTLFSDKPIWFDHLFQPQHWFGCPRKEIGPLVGDQRWALLKATWWYAWIYKYVEWYQTCMEMVDSAAFQGVNLIWDRYRRHRHRHRHHRHHHHHHHHHHDHVLSQKQKTETIQPMNWKSWMYVAMIIRNI